MRETNADPPDMEATMETWLKSVTDFWGGMNRMWLKPFAPASELGKAEKGPARDAQAAMEAALKNWTAVSTAFSDTESIETLLKSTGAMPQILSKLAQVSFGGFLQLNQKWMEAAGRVGKTTEAYSFEDIDENLFRVWTEIYEKEFRQFFRIPQLGLTREYQEKLNRAIDQYNIFQSTLGEFLRLLSTPLSRSYAVMQEKVAEMTEEGSLPEDPKVLYREWIKVLEGHYMTLYQSSDYQLMLAKTLGALSAFSAAKNSVVEDVMSNLPVPSQSEIDDMAREIYELKKELRTMKKQLK